MPRHRLHKPLAEIGLWVVTRWLDRVAEAGGGEQGIAHVARQMRKQGYPPEITAAILGRAPINTEGKSHAQPPESHAQSHARATPLRPHPERRPGRLRDDSLA